jgi:hypothetical protein
MKEYFELVKNPESGVEEKKKLGPAYDPESEDFQRELLQIRNSIERAAKDVYLVETGSERLAQQRSRSLLGAVIKELYGGDKFREEVGTEHEPDPTLALAVIEVRLAQLQDAKEEMEAREEKPDYDIVSIVEGRREVLAEEKEYRRIAEFLYRIHPLLTELYKKKDMVEQVGLLKDQLESFIKKNKFKPWRRIYIERLEADLDSFDRYLKGNPSSSDFEALIRHLEEILILTAQKKLAKLLLSYDLAPWDPQRTRDIILKKEKLIFRYRQMIGLLEEERNLLRLPKTKK